MPHRPIFPLATLALTIALLAPGCGKHHGLFFPLLNQRPTLELTAAPVGVADTAWYSYEIHWSGHDRDGQVARFEYAIDPPAAPQSDTTWIATTKNQEQFHFRATEAYWDPVHGWRSNGFHVFAIRALDDAGAASAVASRAFYSYTIAPVVLITSPVPNKFISRTVSPGVRIDWEGRDDDGVFTRKPVQYKYRLFRVGDTEFDFQKALLYPDSLRTFYAARNFAGWDSVGGDTAFVQYAQLTPNVRHLFVVVAIDEAGAYSPEFSLESNMLMFTPGFPGTLGPVFTVWNEYLQYSYVSGGMSTDPLAWLDLEVPAGRPLTFHWRATPAVGTHIAWYRWKLDGDVADETPRANEATDWGHWSRKDSLTTSCTIGPFPGGQEHFLYIEAGDSGNLVSLATVHFRVIAMTGGSELLVVDDTRMAPDRFGSNGVPLPYGNTLWPAAAELDTFLYARGGFPWRGPQGITGALPPSKPGVFAGYPFDTLGTRQGYSDPSLGVPLSLLGRYRHVLWLTDVTGALTTYTPESLIDPISTLRWMSTPGRMSTLSAYAHAGGEVWLAGGTALTCTQLPTNATASRNNDGIYGPGFVVFSSTNGELVPNTLAWDGAHWRSEFVAGRSFTLPTRSTAAVGGWSNPGWNYSGTIVAPDYSGLPAQMRRRALALGDSLPPTRTGYAATYYSSGVTVPVEYLTKENLILEDMNPDPAVTDLRRARHALRAAGRPARDRDDGAAAGHDDLLSRRRIAAVRDDGLRPVELVAAGRRRTRGLRSSRPVGHESLGEPGLRETGARARRAGRSRPAGPRRAPRGLASSRARRRHAPLTATPSARTLPFLAREARRDGNRGALSGPGLCHNDPQNRRAGAPRPGSRHLPGPE